MAAEFVVPTGGGCLALLDPSSYEGFVDDDWQIEQLKQHISRQCELERIVAWGCVSGDWRIQVRTGGEPAKTLESFGSVIRSSGQLLLTSYESLTMAAQFHDVSLPEPHEVGNLVQVPKGRYEVHIGQAFEQSDAESERVFDLETPHFHITLMPSERDSRPFSGIPWFPL